MSPSYAELHCLSNFSFLRGASHPEELVETAARLGYKALALTDECSLAGVVRAHVATRTHQLQLIVGTELRLTQSDGSTLDLVLLATNREGYGNLSELITRARRAAKKGAYALPCAQMDEGLAHCLALWLPSEYPRQQDVKWIKARFVGSAWIAVELHAGQDDAARLRQLQILSERTSLPLVAAGNVHMHTRARRLVQDTLTAIRLGRPIHEAGAALFANGERHLRPLEQLAQIYPPELLAESLNVAARCDFSLDSLRYEYPEELTPAGASPISYLRHLVDAGFLWRFGCEREPDGGHACKAALRTAPMFTPHKGTPNLTKARALVAHELRLIAELGYEPYFLTVHDIVRFARSRGILCQGRGSAANSAVCYCLGITEVDPARMELLFERFLSKERNEPPDIDVDFEHERREEVIQYIYEKYGRDRAALAATIITYRPRSAIRDIGKALGMEWAQVDRLAKNMAWWEGGDIHADRIREAGLNPDSALMRRFLYLLQLLKGFPRHLSQHVGGFVISQGPLCRLVPIENAAMPGRTVIQWDKDDLDALGLLKVDVLALGMLSAIRRALDLVGQQRGHPMTMADVPAEDPQVYDMIGQADTVGVFQVESRAQQAMLPRMKPRNFYDLVIEVAIVRPGPIQGGMVHPYLRRRQGLEPVTYPSEAIKGVLERTLGVPIFQEQVMQLAITAAGFSPGEADKLRRAMAAWRRKGGLEPFEARLKEGMRARGYSEAFADSIYRQILGFGEYGFPESHSASFALLVYVSAWLKHHAPAAFTCALLNSQPMGFYAPAQLVQDARRHEVTIRPADAYRSQWDCTLEYGDTSEPALRLGLRMIKGLSQEAAQRWIEARSRHHDHIEMLALEARLNSKDMQALAASGALASVTAHRRQATWIVSGIDHRPPPLLKAMSGEAIIELPVATEAEDLVADYKMLGLTLGRHPMSLLRSRMNRLRMRTAQQLRDLPHKSLARTAGLVIGRQRPDSASGVIFVTLEDETGFVNVVVWSATAAHQRRALLSARLLGVYGVVERQGEVLHLIAGRLSDHTNMLGDLSLCSRDFH
ncbi:MAG: error-prone DNA polymerase [Betaproteobacteria bacterium]|nr:error-prone DNA polymerase [Betaproteobacteria bacterium]